MDMHHDLTWSFFICMGLKAGATTMGGGQLNFSVSGQLFQEQKHWCYSSLLEY